MDDEALQQIRAEFALNIEQALAILATACARQLDASLLANNLRGMNASIQRRQPATLLNHWIERMCSAVELMGTPGRPADH